MFLFRNNSHKTSQKHPFKKYFFLITIVLICITTYFLIAPDEKSDTSEIASSTQKDFEHFTNQLFEEQLALDPFSMHFYLLHPESLGIEKVTQSLGEYSYDSMLQSQNYYIDLITNMKNFCYDDLSQNQKITYDTLMSHFQNQLDFADLCLCSEDLSPTTGIQAQLPILFSEYTLSCKQDIENFLTLLSGLDEYYKQICAFQKLKAESNSFISDFCCEHIIEQCRNFIGDGTAKNNYIYTSFVSRLDKSDYLTPEEKYNYVNQCADVISDSVIPAYQNLIACLSSLKKNGACKNNNGLFHLKNGKDYYEFLVKNYIGSSKSIDEIKSAIQDNLDSDLKTMQDILSSNPALQEQFYADRQTDLDPEDILSDLMKKAKEDFPISDDLSYSVKYVDKSLEEYLSPAFYLSPPIDSTNNNTIYINRKRTNSNLDIYTTLAHEGIPGHLLQSSYFIATNPSLIRHIIGCGGYTEGWATYVEFLSYFYECSDKQLAKVLSSSSSYSLALYSICDIGVNYEGWTYEDTCDYLSKYHINNSDICKNIFEAVIEEPANYLQYYVGYLEILNIRSAMQKSLGDKFDLKKFHEAFLTIGPAGFDVVDKWISQVYLDE